MKYPKVCIIILNWNGKELLKNCLSSLFKLTDYPNYKVIVVDNGSTDGSVEFVKKNFPKADVLALDKNYGFPKGNNEGIRYALKRYNPKYVVLLNNDTIIIQKNWLKEMVKVAESDKKIGIIGCKLIYPDGRIQWAGRKKESNIFYLMFQTISASLNPGIGKKIKESSFIGEVNTASGACMMIKKELIKRIGLLDEDLSPFFQEDVEYSFRAQRSGYKVYYVGTTSVVHLQSYSFKKRKMEDEKLYFALRNSMIVSKKYFGYWRTIILGLPILILTAFLERRDKTLGFSLWNLKPRPKLFSKFLLVLNIIRKIVR
ncbi:MAG: glycosyltransferase family 2 protein [Candidatus Aenigmatarchaeota archaeon]